MIFEDISQNSGNKATKESQIQKNLINFKTKKTQIIVVMVGRKFRPFFMLSFKNLVGISSGKND